MCIIWFWYLRFSTSSKIWKVSNISWTLTSTENVCGTERVIVKNMGEAGAVLSRLQKSWCYHRLNHRLSDYFATMCDPGPFLALHEVQLGDWKGGEEENSKPRHLHRGGEASSSYLLQPTSIQGDVQTLRLHSAWGKEYESRSLCLLLCQPTHHGGLDVQWQPTAGTNQQGPVDIRAPASILQCLGKDKDRQATSASSERKADCHEASSSYTDATSSSSLGVEDATDNNNNNYYFFFNISTCDKLWSQKIQVYKKTKRVPHCCRTSSHHRNNYSHYGSYNSNYNSNSYINCNSNFNKTPTLHIFTKHNTDLQVVQNALKKWKDALTWTHSFGPSLYKDFMSEAER